MIAEVIHGPLPISVFFEEDDRVAYAYLLREDKIVADVWLYNVGETPSQAEWNDPANLPFQNPAGFVRQGIAFARPSTANDLSIQWMSAADGRLGAIVKIRHESVAELYEGDKPGRALLAAKNGPLAKILKPHD